MVEYGNGIGEVSGRAGGGGSGNGVGGSGPSLQFDSIELFLTNAVDTISASPALMLLTGVVVLVLLFVVLKRAF